MYKGVAYSSKRLWPSGICCLQSHVPFGRHFGGRQESSACHQHPLHPPFPFETSIERTSDGRPAVVIRADWDQNARGVELGGVE